MAGNRTSFVHNGEVRLMTPSSPSDFNIHVVGGCANSDRKTYSITLGNNLHLWSTKPALGKRDHGQRVKLLCSFFISSISHR